MLSEANIIACLKNEFPEQIGDDAAIIPLSETQSYVITKDLLVERVHFDLNYFDAVSLAHKALHVNLSDIAAMGATPQFVLLGLAIPSFYANQVPQFLEAFTKSCKETQVLLIGGDTTRSPDTLLLSVTVIGLADNTRIKYRHSAHVNDRIYLAGQLGHAHLGLQALETSIDGFESFKQSCLKPTARLQEGLWLAEHAGVHAMMDCSDGLFIDLKRLCEASNVSAEIHCDDFQATPELTAACQQLKLDPLTTQLSGGEDYGLLMTLDAAQSSRIATEFEAAFGYPLTPIGHIKQGHGISFLKNGKPQWLTLNPFTHFGEVS